MKTKTKPSIKTVTPRDRFIRAVAEYLTSDVAHKSILCQMGNKEDARKWAAAYSASNCPGYATADAAEEAIKQLLAQQ